MRFTLLASILVLPFLCLAQSADNTNRKNKNNIYYQSFLQYIKHSGINSDTVFIESDFKYTDSVLNQIGKTKLLIIGQEDLMKYLGNRKSLVLYRFFPLGYENNYFSVSFVPFIVTYQKEKNNINFTNPGSVGIIYRFEKGKFYYIKVADHGI